MGTQTAQTHPDPPGRDEGLLACGWDRGGTGGTGVGLVGPGWDWWDWGGTGLRGGDEITHTVLKLFPFFFSSCCTMKSDATRSESSLLFKARLSS